METLRGVLEGLKGKAKAGKAEKRFIPVLEEWIATPPTIIRGVVDDGVTKVGALMDKATVTQMGGEYMHARLALLRTWWNCVLFKDGSPIQGWIANTGKAMGSMFADCGAQDGIHEPRER